MNNNWLKSFKRPKFFNNEMSSSDSYVYHLSDRINKSISKNKYSIFEPDIKFTECDRDGHTILYQMAIIYKKDSNMRIRVKLCPLSGGDGCFSIAISDCKEFGDFNFSNLPDSLNDVNFCQKLRRIQKGIYNIFRTYQSEVSDLVIDLYPY